MSEIKWTCGKSVRIINKASEFYDLVEYHTIQKTKLNISTNFNTRSKTNQS